jgi:hypothetical protein
MGNFQLAVACPVSCGTISLVDDFTFMKASSTCFRQLGVVWLAVAFPVIFWLICLVDDSDFVKAGSAS